MYFSMVLPAYSTIYYICKNGTEKHHCYVWDRARFNLNFISTYASNSSKIPKRETEEIGITMPTVFYKSTHLIQINDTNFFHFYPNFLIYRCEKTSKSWTYTFTKQVFSFIALSIISSMPIRNTISTRWSQFTRSLWITRKITSAQA